MTSEEVEAAVARLRESINSPRFLYLSSRSESGHVTESPELVRTNPVDLDDLARVILAVWDRLRP